MSQKSTFRNENLRQPPNFWAISKRKKMNFIDSFAFLVPAFFGGDFNLDLIVLILWWTSSIFFGERSYHIGDPFSSTWELWEEEVYIYILSAGWAWVGAWVGNEWGWGGF